jgi:hypothetical protein
MVSGPLSTVALDTRVLGALVIMDLLMVLPLEVAVMVVVEAAMVAGIVTMGTLYFRMVIHPTMVGHILPLFLIQD